MITFGRYLLAQYKRIAKLVGGMAVMILVLSFLTLLCGYAYLSHSKDAAEEGRYKLGIVGSTEDEMLGMGVTLLETSDESRYMIELVTYDNKDEALRDMRAGEISAFVVITDEFTDAINALKNESKIEYFATSSQRGITNIMMDELADIASGLIVYSEKGLLTLREIMKNEGIDAKTIGQSVDELLLLYISAMLTRTDIAEFTEIGYSDGVPVAYYYMISMTLFFLLIISFCGIPYFLNKHQGLYRLLAAKGLDAKRQITAEYVAYFSIGLIGIIIIGLLYALLTKINALADYSKILQVGVDIKSIINICLIALLFSTMSFFINELIDGVINKFLISFVVYIGMAYVSGYFYPKSFFPMAVRRIGGYLPTGLAFSLMEDGYTKVSDVMTLAWILCYIFVFLGSSILIRKRKIK